MVNYPNKKNPLVGIKKIEGRINTTGRGMNLEEDINLSNKYFLAQGLANIHKKPTPIRIVNVQYPKRSAAKIVEAYFQTPSTTDYNGIYRSRYLDFEAKETKRDTFPFTNISEHQINHLADIKRHGGIAFVIIAFLLRNEVYLIDASIIVSAYRSGRRSIKYAEINEKGHLIKQGYNPRLDYLKIIDQVYIDRED